MDGELAKRESREKEPIDNESIEKESGEKESREKESREGESREKESREKESTNPVQVSRLLHYYVTVVVRYFNLTAEFNQCTAEKIPLWTLL